jgi:DNA repair protein RecN (Recombination protein N)
MLRELFIQDLAIIEEARIEFHRGLNVLTGETGAGKSLLVGALELVLGERAKAEWIRSGAKEARVEAVFDLQTYPDLKPVLEEAGLPADDNLVVRRTVTHAGKNRVYINDRASTLGLLDTLGRRLVDIHGQHEHQSLLVARRHRELIDLFGGLLPLREEVSRMYRELRDLQGDLARVDEAYQRMVAEKDLAAHQCGEISEARLRDGEEEELEQERKKLLHAERLREICLESEQLLYSDRNAMVDIISRLQKQLSEASELDPELREPAEQLETARVYLEEAATHLRDYMDDIEGDPNRLEEIEDRIGTIHRLKRKYRCSVEELISLGEELEGKIRSLDHYEDERKAREEKIRQTRDALFEAVESLSRKRKLTAGTLETQIVKELQAVGMKETAFRVEVLGIPSEGEDHDTEGDGVRFQGRRVDASGMDRIEFLIRPNPGQDFKPLRRIASGGELSRIMLALRNVLHRSDRLPTLVFDEVDAGIGGAEAEAVGSRLKRLGRDFQILCITHLPQIAVFGETHLKVQKQMDKDRTRFQIRQMSDGDREMEIARMLGGKKITQKTVAHAREMIRRGEKAGEK